MCFCGGVNNVANNTAGQLATGNLQFIRGCEIKTEFDAQALGEIGEATRENGGAQAGVLAGFEQLAGAG